MEIKLLHSELKLIEYLESNALDVQSIKKHIKSDVFLDAFETYRYRDNYKSFSKTIHKSLYDYPLLQQEIKKVSKSLDFDMEYLLRSVRTLGLITEYDKTINVCTAMTGFECAAGAYGNTIYFGLEWLVNPDNINLPEDDYRYDFMTMLSDRLNEFIEETIPHEIVHIMSVKPDDDDSMFRMIEEGRACYVTHLLNPNWSLEKILPMNIVDLEFAIENESTLMKSAYASMCKDANETIKNLFSPIGSFMNIKLAGYYIAYKLIETHFNIALSFEDKVNALMTFTDGRELLNRLSTYN